MLANDKNPNYNSNEFIIIDIVGCVIFLLPRCIGLFYVNSKSKVTTRPQNITYVNQWTIKYKQTNQRNIMIGLKDIKLRILLIYIYYIL